MQSRYRALIKPLAIALATVTVLSACGQGAQQGAGGAPGGPGMPSVGVIVAEASSVPLVSELSGRTTPFMVAELRPQVSGIVHKRLFTEGSEVKAGQTLYQIDPATYQAAYDSARASLARAEANLYSARLKAERHAELVKIEAVSKQANDDAIAALKQAEADLAAARAALDKAKIDLDFTRVASPISGRIGRSTVTPGALVTANQADSLATVQQLDPIYVDLTQSTGELLQMRRALEAGKLKPVGDQSVPVRLVLEDGSLYAAEGKLAFSEVSVDTGTGSVTLRAIFPNTKGELLPGMYVRARLVQGQAEEAILVPHAAVSRDPRGNATVMVVGAEDKVEAKVVQTARSQGDKWVVTEGLRAGDRVIVEGLQKVRPGVQVQAQPLAPVAAAGAPVVSK
ncbi:efflux RND transporter periplasmic adaptor subunit [Parazoarcus communis]|uniref:Efflux transporter periplasmic adaptor subunit n=1 Tax=Parazoarcus communis SWub3 = DSM 12120 TaxID=1121029 RepID=A0A323URY7_9RHOO|nr:efflux RND transporter periplasmic adaptor subunit [Parazoarcus communis]NMG71907.1 efflux RND transporter periplasmic adaptor subunit [Parazoarcus communis SWub3 = DSM 12120]PZA15294.1 efflux transporter periplasmic adaptor subunit [Azoarcus communis] [Parazoarcus communis SWub3 = DSM 12120]